MIAITAIRDMNQEGFIASALTRGGWRVSYRATSPERLLEKLKSFPTATLFLSDDFLPIESISFAGAIYLRGRSNPLGAQALSNPQSELELEDLIRSNAPQRVSEVALARATTSRLILLTSSAGRVGVTTLAINLSDHLARLGEKVLLVDADRGNHSIAAHFEIHDIRSQAKEIRKGFSLLEVSGGDQLSYLASIAGEFDSVIIDFGVARGLIANGVRIDEKVFSWVARSYGRFFFLSPSGERSIERSLLQLNFLENIAPRADWQILLILEKIMSRKDRARLMVQISERSQHRAEIFSRDSKSIDAAEKSHSTLNEVAPRSILNREIARFLTERVEKSL